MNRHHEDAGLTFFLLLVVLALIAVAELVCSRNHRGGTLGWLGLTSGGEVKEIKRAPLLLLLASWHGCYSPSYAPPELGDGAPASYVRALAPVGRAPLEADASGPFAFDSAAPPAPDTRPQLDTGEPSVNVSAPLPAATVAWLAAVPSCGASFAVAHPWDNDPCEGWTRNGVRCVECVGPPPARLPLSAECQSTGSCVTGESTPFLCVADCRASCARAPRYCPPQGVQ
jgi:hypothetical protein